jgi:isopenicillin-N N-acyltransferase-like protein
MASRQIPVITVKGSPYDCGQQYGRQAEKLIQQNLAFYFDMWQSLWGAKREEIRQQCRSLVDVIGNYDAEIMEELEGIANGANSTLGEIIAINARYEINSSRGITRNRVNDGCTSVAALPPVVKNGHVILGQNWDWLTRFQSLNVILEVERDGKPNVVTQPEAGAMAHRGMNSAGLGACFNGMASNKDKFESSAPPFLIMMRAILNASSFSEALESVLRTGPTLSGNYLIAHRDGETVDLEVSPTGTGVLYAEENILTHSNHFMSFTNRGDFIDLLKPMYPDTLLRHSRARHLLELDKNQIDVDSFKRVFGDHFSHPKSICRHTTSQDVGLKGWATLASMIMDLTEGAIYVTEGPPCQNEYYKLVPEILRKE